MAEIAALSLAANIVQFVGFGASFISKVWSIYRNSRDSLEELSDLETMAEYLKLNLADMNATGVEGQTDSQRSFHQLAKQCIALANEMTDGLRKIGISSKNRKRDALKAAVRLVWKEDEIHSQQQRLESIKQQLSLHILVLLREQSQKSLGQQEAILSQLVAVRSGAQQFEAIMSRVEVQGVGPGIFEFLTDKIGPAERNAWHSGLISTLHEGRGNSLGRDLSGLAISDARREALQSAFITRLRYPGIEDRQERVADAYKKTFRWIFEDQEGQVKPWSSFKNWLESDSPLYWMTGKAGSGKSTLMKFICSEGTRKEPFDTSIRRAPPQNPLKVCPQRQSRSEEYLRNWASGSRLITATFFFWASGDHLQRSKTGLLRSLLYQILRQCPDQIPSVAPGRWEALCLFNDDIRGWNKPELEVMLKELVAKLSQAAKVCLFVDGLDEFDGHHDDLIDIFHDLISHPNVKICVSSRPWVQFEDAFKHEPSLTLENLTYLDIKHYVSSRFNENTGFAQLRIREPAYAEQLVENIVSKASGVFLWVHLVVISLIAGMNYGDRVSDLQRRLDLLPSDLSLLYDRILHDLDPFYLEHTSQLFRLVQESKGPPSLLLLSFADEESPDSALNQPVKALAPDELFIRLDTMRRRLNSRCKGLLEVKADSQDTAGSTVQYLHRTVKDYIENPQVRDRFSAAMKSPFDPQLRLCCGALALLKTHNVRSYYSASNREYLCRLVHLCLERASRIDATDLRYLVPLLDNLDMTGRELAVQVAANTKDLAFYEGTGHKALTAGQWVSFYFSRAAPLMAQTFLSLVTRHGVTEYIKARTDCSCLVQQDSGGLWPLLQDALLLDREGDIYYLEQCSIQDKMIETVKFLLERGADPNFVFRLTREFPSVSVWTSLLEMLLKYSTGYRVTEPWPEVLGLMINYGANVSKKFLHHRFTPHLRNSEFYEQLMEIKNNATRPRRFRFWLKN
ncbi:MAG: hypothetical protein M1820_004493 [Bogoriella megaspora]|nr:MAG: hypothetical protein M1820_004493 [Bogoriella megaspora]